MALLQCMGQSDRPKGQSVSLSVCSSINVVWYVSAYNILLFVFLLPISFAVY